MLKLISINKQFKDKIIYKNFTYEFNNTGIYILKGKSGIGKTTLLNIISGLQKIDSGSIEYPSNVRNIYKDISYIYQDNNLFENLSLIDNIKLVLDIKKELYDESKTIDILKQLDIINLKDYPVSQLSGGEKQRVNIAIALILKSKIILVDEGLANLDDFNKDNILNILKNLSSDHLIILSTHDEYILNQFDTNIINLDNKEEYQESYLKLKDNRKDKKFNVNVFKAFSIDFKIIKKQKVRLFFATLIFIAFFYFLSYSLCLKSLTKVKLVSDDIINNNVSGFVIRNFDTNDSKIKDFKAKISNVSYVGLDTRDFEKYTSSNEAIVNNFIFDDNLEYGEIILTDYSISLLKKSGLLLYNDISDCIGETLKLKYLDLTIKDIVITNYTVGEKYFYDNKIYSYYYGYISTDTFIKIKPFTDDGILYINDIVCARNENTLNINDNEIYMSDKLIEELFNTETPADYYDQTYTFEFKCEIDGSISYSKEFIIRHGTYYYSDSNAFELSSNSQKEIYENLRNFIPDKYFNYGYYVSNWKNTNSLKKILNYIYSNGGEIGYKDYTEIFYRDYAISSFRKTFEIISYIMLAITIIFTTFSVYSMHISNKDNINKLKIYGLSNKSLYKIFNVEFVIPLGLSLVLGMLFTILSCNEFDNNYLDGININSFNIGMILITLIIFIIVILVCNLIPFVIRKKEKEEN